MSASPQLAARIRRKLSEASLDPTAQTVAALLRQESELLGDGAVLDLVDELRRDTVGAGPLDELLGHPEVTDVLVNGADEVYVDGSAGLQRTEIRFADDEAVRRLAQRLATQGGRRLDDARPFVDVRLPDGTRFHAVLAPIARPGTLISLRVPARRAFELSQLVDSGSLSPMAAELLTNVVVSRTAFLVTGGTGSGKTTLLASLLGLVDPSERIVIVEDATELRPDHQHVVGLEGRATNAEGAGAIELRDLVRQALRMRPDRLIVGEVRGAEVVDLLAALNTGHEGGCGTLHANSAADVPARIEALGVAAGLSRAAVHSQLASAIGVIVHVRRGNDRVRRLAEIAVLRREDSGLVVAIPAVRFDGDNCSHSGAGMAELEQFIGPVGGVAPC